MRQFVGGFVVALCLIPVLGVEPAITVLPTLFWMHIQKTSSWLGNFLLLWGCPSLREPQGSSTELWSNPMAYSVVAKRLPSVPCQATYYTGKFGYGYHVPYPVELNQTTVTLFRNPYDRVISAFLYGKGIHQIMFPLGYPDRAKVKFALREKIKKSEFSVLSYASLPGIASCQTKMVLGMECGEPVNITRHQLIEAMRRVTYDLAFVGLTEESDASARLFLAMYKPPAQLSEEGAARLDKNKLVATLQSAPRANKGHTAEVNGALLETLQAQGWRDRPDEVVYTAAVQVFYERCKRYGISTRHTATELLKW